MVLLQFRIFSCLYNIWIDFHDIFGYMWVGIYFKDCPTYLHFFHVSAPAISLPMDVVDAGVVQGSIPGTLVGRRAELTTGVRGNALVCDGSDWPCVDYGEHFDQCYHNPDMCTEGVTMSFWVSQNVYQGVIFSTGYQSNTVGHTINFPGFGKMVFVTSHNTSNDYYEVHGWGGDHLHKWRYVVATWYLGEGITIYINGCDADPGKSKGYAKTASRRKPNTARGSIQIGLGSGYNGLMMLDEFFIWHERLSPEQIWQLYTQGGNALG